MPLTENTHYAVQPGIVGLQLNKITTSGNFSLFGLDTQISRMIDISITQAEYPEEQEEETTFKRDIRLRQKEEHFLISDFHFMVAISGLQIGGVAVPVSEYRRNFKPIRKNETEIEDVKKQLKNCLSEYESQIAVLGKKLFSMNDAMTKEKAKRMPVILSSLVNNFGSNIKNLYNECSSKYDDISVQFLGEAFHILQSSMEKTSYLYDFDNPLSVERKWPEQSDEGFFLKATITQLPEKVSFPDMDIPVNQAVLLQFGNACIKNEVLHEKGVFAEILMPMTKFSKLLTTFNICDPTLCCMPKREHTVVQLTEIVPPPVDIQAVIAKNIQNYEKLLSSWLDEMKEMAQTTTKMTKKDKEVFSETISQMKKILEEKSENVADLLVHLHTSLAKSKGEKAYSTLRSVTETLGIGNVANPLFLNNFEAKKESATTKKRSPK